MRENSHINISDPDQGEQGNYVSAPIGVEELEARDDQKQGCNVVTEAVFACEQIEELALPESFAPHSFACNSPGARGKRLRK